MTHPEPINGTFSQFLLHDPFEIEFPPAVQNGSWMQRLKRVFNIDIETCERCAGQVKIIVETSNRCIEDPAVIERILAHLKSKAPSVGTALLPENRGPPQARLGVPASSTDSMTP
jgi:hypothetical protein